MARLDDPFDRTTDSDSEEKVRCGNCRRRFYTSSYGAAKVEDNWFCSENCYDEWDEDGRIKE